MTAPEWVEFLQWSLGRLGLRWNGFRNVRGQVCKRIARRIAELGLSDLRAYRETLERDPAEWNVLDQLCVVTISRFYRDRKVWDTLCEDVLPALAEAALTAQDDSLRCWSLGCASGEEPYTLSIVWTLGVAARYPSLRMRILATDVDALVLERARVAEYAEGTLRELPTQWLDQAFDRQGKSLRLRERFRSDVEIRQEDVRTALPDELFRLILCRNVAFTYFDEPLQRTTLARLVSRCHAGAALLIGPHEKLPAGAPLEPWYPHLGIHRFVPV